MKNDWLKENFRISTRVIPTKRTRPIKRLKKKKTYQGPTHKTNKSKRQTRHAVERVINESTVIIIISLVPII